MATADLSSVATVTTGSTPSTKSSELYGGDIPFVKPSDLDRGEPIFRTEQTLSPAGAAEVRLVRPGAVLVSCIGNLGKVGIAGTALATNQQINAVEFLGEAVLDRFGYYACRTLRGWMEREASATTISILNKGRFSQAQIPVPPMAEQQRIADKLDAVVARVDACRDRLARVTPLLKRFRQSVLAAATSGRLFPDWHGHYVEAVSAVHARSPMVIYSDEQDGLPAGWAWRHLVDLARLESGHTPRKSVAAYWDGGDVSWISLQDIRAADGRVLYETKFHPTQAGIDNSSARLLPEGTVCFCRDISFGYVTIMGKPMATSQHFANWVCGPQLLPKYLMYAFMAGRQFLGMSGQGTTVTTIYMPALKELRLATPSLEEQAEIVRRVDTLFAFADRLEARLAKAQAAADRLTPALLAKAFRGELVPQDPADEPAAVLLQRLAASRPASVAKARRPRAGQGG